MSTFSRRFGVEIEFETTLSKYEIAGILGSDGVSAITSTGSDKSTSTSWKVVTDGSLGDGLEIVSPVLSGEEGIQQIHRVCKLLSDRGLIVNRKCGLHVHVEANDLRDVDILHVVTRYTAFEGEIDSWMPRSRRGSSNGMCKSATDTARLFLDADFKDMNGGQIRRRLGTPGIHDDRRYSKVNLCPYIRQGTIEFRHHSGTVNAVKIENWVRFVVAFVESSKVGTTTREITENVPVITGPNGRPRRTNSILTKFELLAGLLDDNYSVSTEKIASTLDISGASVPSYISNFRAKYGVHVKCSPNSGNYLSYDAGILMRVREKNGLSADGPVIPTTRVVNRTVTEPVLSVGTVWDGVPDPVRSFYIERAMELA